jgi:hypothetical protein
MLRDSRGTLSEGLIGGLVVAVLTVSEASARKWQGESHGWYLWLVFGVAFVVGFLCIAAVAAFLHEQELDELHQTCRETVRLVLCGTKHEYLSCLLRRGQQSPPEVRFNVMVPHKGKPRSRERDLRIVYMDDPDSFVSCEKAVCWKPEFGKCGQAFKQGNSVWWAKDLKTEGPNTALQPMPQECHARLNKLGSVFSTPILSSDKTIVMGILNMDSPEGNSKTCVNDEGVKALFENAAKEIAAFIPPRGVGEVGG